MGVDVVGATRHPEVLDAISPNPPRGGRCRAGHRDPRERGQDGSRHGAAGISDDHPGGRVAGAAAGSGRAPTRGDRNSDRRPRAAIRELIAGYALALDAGDIDGCVRAVHRRCGIPGLRTGLSPDTTASARCSGDAPRGLHLTGVSRIDVRDDTATARSQVLFVRAGDLQLRPALYDDELVRRRWAVAIPASALPVHHQRRPVRQPGGSVIMTPRRVALVTGAAGGQGWAIAKRLRAAGLLRGGLRSPCRRTRRHGRRVGRRRSDRDRARRHLPGAMGCGRRPGRRPIRVADHTGQQRRRAAPGVVGRRDGRGLRKRLAGQLSGRIPRHARHARSAA